VDPREQAHSWAPGYTRAGLGCHRGLPQGEGAGASFTPTGPRGRHRWPRDRQGLPAGHPGPGRHRPPGHGERRSTGRFRKRWPTSSTAASPGRRPTGSMPIWAACSPTWNRLRF